MGEILIFSHFFVCLLMKTSFLFQIHLLFFKVFNFPCSILKKKKQFSSSENFNNFNFTTGAVCQVILKTCLFYNKYLLADSSDFRNDK